MGAPITDPRVKSRAIVQEGPSKMSGRQSLFAAPFGDDGSGSSDSADQDNLWDAGGDSQGGDDERTLNVSVFKSPGRKKRFIAGRLGSGLKPPDSPSSSEGAPKISPLAKATFQSNKGGKGKKVQEIEDEEEDEAYLSSSSSSSSTTLDSDPTSADDDDVDVDGDDDDDDVSSAFDIQEEPLTKKTSQAKKMDLTREAPRVDPPGSESSSEGSREDPPELFPAQPMSGPPVKGGAGHKVASPTPGLFDDEPLDLFGDVNEFNAFESTQDQNNNGSSSGESAGWSARSSSDSKSEKSSAMEEPADSSKGSSTKVTSKGQKFDTGARKSGGIGGKHGRPRKDRGSGGGLAGDDDDDDEDNRRGNKGRSDPSQHDNKKKAKDRRKDPNEEDDDDAFGEPSQLDDVSFGSDGFGAFTDDRDDIPSDSETNEEGSFSDVDGEENDSFDGGHDDEDDYNSGEDDDYDRDEHEDDEGKLITQPEKKRGLFSNLFGRKQRKIDPPSTNSPRDPETGSMPTSTKPKGLFFGLFKAKKEAVELDDDDVEIEFGDNRDMPETDSESPEGSFGERDAEFGGSSNRDEDDTEGFDGERDFVDEDEAEDHHVDRDVGENEDEYGDDLEEYAEDSGTSSRTLFLLLCLAAVVIVGSTVGTAFWGTKIYEERNGTPRDILISPPVSAPTWEENECEYDQNTLLEFRILFDSKPEQTGFVLRDAGLFETVIWDFEPSTFRSFSQFQKKNTFRICLSDRLNYTFELVDTLGNGMISNFGGTNVYGLWELAYNSKTVAAYNANCDAERTDSALAQATNDTLYLCGEYCQCEFSLNNTTTGGGCLAMCSENMTASPARSITSEFEAIEPPEPAVEYATPP